MAAKRTEQMYARAAFAGAEAFRKCGAENLMMQKESPERSFIRAKLGRFQADHSLRSIAAIEERA